jgi:hypothetical protein
MSCGLNYHAQLLHESPDSQLNVHIRRGLSSSVYTSEPYLEQVKRTDCSWKRIRIVSDACHLLPAAQIEVTEQRLKLHCLLLICEFSFNLKYLILLCNLCVQHSYDRSVVNV